jgi:hypothetical protein
MSDVDDLLSTYSPAVQGLARSTRVFVRNVLPKTDERVDASARVIGYGVAPGYKGLICTIIMSKGGVKLGIVNGASLPDPAGLLEGSGKVHKYVPIESEDDLRRPELCVLLRAAASARK